MELLSFSCYVALLLCGLLDATNKIKEITFPLLQPLEKLPTRKSPHLQLCLEQQSLQEG